MMTFKSLFSLEVHLLSVSVQHNEDHTLACLGALQLWDGLINKRDLLMPKSLRWDLQTEGATSLDIFHGCGTNHSFSNTKIAMREALADYYWSRSVSL